MAQLVKFWHNTKAQYDLLTVKDPATVYFCSDTKEIFRGTNSYSEGVRLVSELPAIPARGVLYIIQSGEKAGGWIDFGTGVTKVLDKYALVGGLTNATTTTAGLMTPEQVGNLNLLLEGRNATSEAIADLKAVKADKVIGAVSGNFAGLDSDGNIVDSGKNAVSFTVGISSSDSSEFSKVYTFTQGGTEIGSINIPKDMVISSGEIQNIAEGTVEQGGSYLPAGKYLVLTIANAAGDKIYIPVSDLSDTYTGGKGITIDSTNVVDLKMVEGNGLVIDETGSLKMNLATVNSAGALSAVDKVKIDRIEKIYNPKKYSITGLGEGCLVDYFNHEIRVLIPNNYPFKKQNSGVGSVGNRFYIPLKIYVPDDTVYLEYGVNEDYSDLKGETFEERIARGFAGVEYGRKYYLVWLSIAETPDEGKTWNYYGSTSNGLDKYIKTTVLRTYSDEAGTKLNLSESIRIVLENEDSWKTHVSAFTPVKSVDPSSGLILSDKGVLSFDTSLIAVTAADIAVKNYAGENTTLDIALIDIYKSIVWQEL